jgi:hypothetical protein
MSAVDGEWGVMETETHKLKQDEESDDSQQNPNYKRKLSNRRKF